MAERITFHKLITEDLKFCCEFCFFKCHRRTGFIAERLGLTPRTVRYHKMAFKDGVSKCEGRANCQKGKLF